MIITVNIDFLLPIFKADTQESLQTSPNVKKSNKQNIYFCQVMILTEVVFDKDFLTISFDPQHKLVYLKWKGYASSENFREGLNYALDIVKDHNAENWLGNLKLMEAIHPLDEEWAIQNWFPQIANTTLRKMAIVTSLDYFNNTSVKRIVNTVVPSICFETRYFVDTIPAREWLFSQA